LVSVAVGSAVPSCLTPKNNTHGKSVGAELANATAVFNQVFMVAKRFSFDELVFEVLDSKSQIIIRRNPVVVRHSAIL
jgi:hypothetical protein